MFQNEVALVLDNDFVVLELRDTTVDVRLTWCLSGVRDHVLGARNRGPLRAALLNIGINASLELVLEGALLLLLAINDCPNAVPTHDLRAVRVERHLSHRLHATASKSLGLLLVTGAEGHEVLSRHGAQAAQYLTLLVRRICAILANFGHAGVVPALEGRVEMVVTDALLLLLRLGSGG